MALPHLAARDLVATKTVARQRPRVTLVLSSRATRRSRRGLELWLEPLAEVMQLSRSERACRHFLRHAPSWTTSCSQQPLRPPSPFLPHSAIRDFQPRSPPFSLTVLLCEEVNQPLFFPSDNGRYSGFCATLKQHFRVEREASCAYEAPGKNNVQPTPTTFQRVSSFQQTNITSFRRPLSGFDQLLVTSVSYLSVIFHPNRRVSNRAKALST
ncbi:hypothetical protein HPB51_026184 [Rhipicephalus microplus]|uniref:Uncharacterized protein n=1 Tax=Rhipicephalus microplus TaxID=6941 RepID=A0A9J6DRE1_RHIMP|nr:hypothetical protein HPB51_026184 [Rhipicephalus microplus]